MNVSQIAITAVAVLALGGAAVGVFALRSDGAPSQTAPAAATATPEAAATGLPVGAPTDAPTPPESLPDRTNCDEIRGTPYRSTSERDFYVKNCLSQAAPAVQQPALSPPLVSADTSASCETDAEITTTRSDETYDVAGTNLDEIANSLQANAPQTEEGTAYGLTEYSYSLNGSFCAEPGSCSLGEISITGEVVVTLPNLTTFDQLSSDVAEVWSDYVDSVAIHEGRHVRILEEGLEEIKLQLLALDEQPDCILLNHEIDKVWALGDSQIESRQRAFHAADAQGRGGLVVQ